MLCCDSARMSQTVCNPISSALTFLCQTLQESLRCYTVVPVVVRELARDDVLCGHHIPRGSHVVQCLKAVHQQWSDPEVWRPERFMPGGEYDQFDEDVRQYMVSASDYVI